MDDHTPSFEPEEMRAVFKDRVKKLCVELSKKSYEIAVEMNPTLLEIQAAYGIFFMECFLKREVSEEEIKTTFEKMLKEYCLVTRKKKDG